MATLALSSAQQQVARARVVHAAQLAYAHKVTTHYTQSSARWQGIDNHLDASAGQHPNYADCSSFATWCLWNALYLPYGLEDVVNGAAWRAGYTGTMLGHGRVISPSDMIAGDCVLYGSGFPGHHTAICVGVSGGTPMVISHGSESGPHYVTWNYRGDVMNVRRYIDGDPHQATGGDAPPPIPTPPPETVSLAVGAMRDGRLEVFAEDKAGTVWHRWQATGGGWVDHWSKLV